MFSKFDLSVGYIPGKENTVADILSRWAYPASQAYRDVSKHGTQEDKEEMEEIMKQEKEEEAQCLKISSQSENQNTTQAIGTLKSENVDEGTPSSTPTIHIQQYAKLRGKKKYPPQSSGNREDLVSPQTAREGPTFPTGEDPTQSNSDVESVEYVRVVESENEEEDDFWKIRMNMARINLLQILRHQVQMIHNQTTHNKS